MLVNVCFFFLIRYGYYRDLHGLTHSFPTRRSSDCLAVREGMRLIEEHDRRSGAPQQNLGGAPASARLVGGFHSPSAQVLRQQLQERGLSELGRAHVWNSSH